VQIPVRVASAIPHHNYPINLLLQRLLLETSLCLNPPLKGATIYRAYAL